MDKPNFVCGAYNVTVEHPEQMQRIPQVRSNMSVMLSGRTRIDTLYRKYLYRLVWRALTKTEYQNLVTLVNYSLDNGATIEFTYPKWNTTQNTVDVYAVLGEMTPIGSGEGDYLVGITIELYEINAQ